jgi:exodeoxyribonuclease-3
MKIATWNVNSLNVRQPHLLAWLAMNPVDVIGIQETKLTDDKFPHDALQAAGYHSIHSGQKTYNGVALLSRSPLTDVSRDIADFDCEQKRVIAATIGDVRVINVYVVNGQALGTDKYAHKLRFLAALRDYVAAELARHPRLAIVGDFNIAPGITDTHDPAVWEGGILCSPAERAGLQALLDLGLQDTYQHTQQPPGRFTWWDYRQAGFRRNLGLRIDHVLASSALTAQCSGWNVDVAPRKLERPSDHAPVIADFATN